MNKLYPDATAALADVLKNGMTIMAGGFGLCGVPTVLIDAVRDSGVKDLTLISTNAGIDGAGLGRLLETKQVRKIISSCIGENKLFETRHLSGEFEFIPQGTLAERIRAGGAGIPAFFTKTGVGTIVAEGKETREFEGDTYLMETWLRADVALVHAWKGDDEGNLVFRTTARNVDPRMTMTMTMAMAADLTVAEVEDLVPTGDIDGDAIHTPGIFVHRLVHARRVSPGGRKRTTRATKNNYREREG